MAEQKSNIKISDVEILEAVASRMSTKFKTQVECFNTWCGGIPFIRFKLKGQVYHFDLRERVIVPID